MLSGLHTTARARLRQLPERLRGARLAGRHAEGGRGLAVLGRVRVHRAAAPGGRLVLGRGIRLAEDVRLELAGPGAVLSIGDEVFVNRRTEITSRSSVTVGARTIVAWDVQILDADGDPHAGDATRPGAPVVIGEGVWLGARATILEGVRIGDGAIVAAGTVVRDDVPPGVLYGGSPPRVLREAVQWHRTHVQ